MFRKLKRRREKKTDYHQRLALLKSGLPRLVVRKSNRYIRVQLVEYEPKSDKVIFTLLSKRLRDYGWNYSFANTPAAYLTGLIAGFLARKKGYKKAVLDIGLQRSTRGNRIYAVVKGCIDAGLEVPHGVEVLPSEERIRGEHIAAYAKLLREKDKERYEKQFSGYLKRNVLPEAIPELFEQVKQRIVEEFGGDDGRAK